MSRAGLTCRRGCPLSRATAGSDCLRDRERSFANPATNSEAARLTDLCRTELGLPLATLCGQSCASKVMPTLVPKRHDNSVIGGCQKAGTRPIIFYPRGATCTQPYVKGLVTMVNSFYSACRMGDVWLDK